MVGTELTALVSLGRGKVARDRPSARSSARAGSRSRSDVTLLMAVGCSWSRHGITAAAAAAVHGLLIVLLSVNLELLRVVVVAHGVIVATHGVIIATIPIRVELLLHRHALQRSVAA